MLKTSRRTIHGAVVSAYEALYAPRLDEHLEMLGMHASEACHWLKAEGYLRRAAQKAIDRSSHAQAILFIREALRALEQSDMDITTKMRGELELRLLLRIAFNAIGNYRERLANLDRAEELAKRLGQHGALPSLWVSRASVTLQLGRVDHAIDLCAKARRSASGESGHETAVIAGYMLSRSYFYAGRFATSLLAARRALALLRQRPGSPRHGGGFGSSEVMLLTQLTQTLACLGEFAEGRQSATEALAVAEQFGRSFDIALASYGFGVVHLYADNPGSAIAVLERGMHASALDGEQSIFAPLGGLLGYAYFRAGRIEDALSMCKRMLTYAEGSLYHGNWPRLFAGMIMHETGDYDGAMRLAEAANAVARKGRYPIQLVWSDLLLGRLHREASPIAAKRHIRRALVQSRSMRMRPCTAWALMEMGHLHRSLGSDDKAQEFRSQATRLARALGLPPEDGAQNAPLCVFARKKDQSVSGSSGNREGDTHRS